ncbi:ParB/RepB/Spo0J family partition protein [Olivibacter jilunii]|uniref:ParB/RepB/Spo0J family partition protein n=1 Tax=Olivibacter jilunii TaxID=985016 RepID=UPI0010323C24|nr:ParB/RepB/Spo0J family partition protein [Olivibacter jilunii]
MQQNRKEAIEYVPVDQLFFDPENPRLPRTVNGSDEQEVINWMLENENVIELMASIAEKGFFPAEPLLVENRVQGGYNVIEGNRRLTAVKLLLRPELAKIRKNSISEIIAEGKYVDSLLELPVIKFVSSNDIQLYLGYRHITGVQPWDSLAKARYLKKLKESLDEENQSALYKSLAKIIGSRVDHVKLLLAGLAVYEKIEDSGFYQIDGLNEKNIKFGVLYTAINNGNIADFIGVNLDDENPTQDIKEDELKELATWMFQKTQDGFTRLGESRNLRQLNKIVNNEKALTAFRRGRTLSDAVLLTDEPIEIFRISIKESLTSLETARDYVHYLSHPSSSYEEILREIRLISKSISSVLKDKLTEEDDDF